MKQNLKTGDFATIKLTRPLTIHDNSYGDHTFIDSVYGEVGHVCDDEVMIYVDTELRVRIPVSFIANPYLIDCRLNRGQVEAMIIALAPLAYPEGLPDYTPMPAKDRNHDGNLVDAFHALHHYASKGGK